MQDQHYVYRARERFFSKLASPDKNGCRRWTGKIGKYSKQSASKGKTSYGLMWFHGKEMYAHVFCARYVLCLDTAGLEVSHLCHNRLCCEPIHLIVETRQQNAARSVEAGHYKGPGTPSKRTGILSEDAVRDILDRCVHARQYGSCSEMAKKYGVSRSLISLVIRLGDSYRPKK